MKRTFQNCHAKHAEATADKSREDEEDQGEQTARIAQIWWLSRFPALVRGLPGTIFPVGVIQLCRNARRGGITL